MVDSLVRDSQQGQHLTLAIEAYHKRTGYMPRGPWVAWVDLYAEAMKWNLEKCKDRLELILASTPSINGWGQQRLVEAMNGEVKPDGPAPAAFVGINTGPNFPVQPPPAAQPERKSFLDRLRGA